MAESTESLFRTLMHHIQLSSSSGSGELAVVESTEAAGSSKNKEEREYEKEEKRYEKEDEKAEVRKPFYLPYNVPVNRSSANTIERLSASLQRFSKCCFSSSPIAVAIGPDDHGSPQLWEVEKVQRAALEEFRRAASQQCEAVHGKVLSLVGPACSCYAGERELRCIKDDFDFADMMLVDGWFLLPFMVSTCPDHPDAPPEADPLMSRAEVHTRIDDIARDVLLLENQVPWFVLEALMELWPAVPVDRFLGL